jgi:hypothetical protein
MAFDLFLNLLPVGPENTSLNAQACPSRFGLFSGRQFAAAPLGIRRQTHGAHYGIERRWSAA